MSEEPEWPSLPDDDPDSEPGGASIRDRARLALFQARLDDVAARRATIRARDAEVAAAMQKQMDVEDRRRDAFLSAYLAVTQATLDRMLKRADTLATVTAAVATIYGSILGVAFSLRDGAPLPRIGIVPAILLGLSLVFVAIYLSSTSKGTMAGRALAAGSGPRADQKRINTFVQWVNAVALKNSWALTCSVVLLGLGIVSFPLPFLV